MDINFVMPMRADELLHGTGYGSTAQYVVKEVLHTDEINKCHKAAQQCFRDVGPTFILDNFDVYFSILHMANELPRSVVYTAYEDLNKALCSLPNQLSIQLEDGESTNEEVTKRTQNILKMLIYLFVSLVTWLENDHNNSDLLVAKSRKKSQNNTATFHCSWVEVITTLNKLLNVDLNKFWDAAGVDELFTNKIAEVIYLFICKPSIKQEKETLSEIWGLIGMLLTQYNVNRILIVHLVRCVKENEHVALILAPGIHSIVTKYKCPAFLANIIRELTEWQITETVTSNENTASRNCSKIIVEMTKLMPTLILKEIAYINKYLMCDSHHLRNMVLSVLVEVYLNVHTSLRNKDHEEDEELTMLMNDILLRLERCTMDVNAVVRAKVFGHVSHLQTESALPLPMVTNYVSKAVDFLCDPTATVRKAAANCLTTIMKHNCYGPHLSAKRFKKELDDRRPQLLEVKYKIFGLDMNTQEELENVWQTKHMVALKTYLIQHFDHKARANMDEDEEEEEPTDENRNPNVSQGNNSNASRVNDRPPVSEDDIRKHIADCNYKQAIQLLEEALRSPRYKNLQVQLKTINSIDQYICIAHLIYSNMSATAWKQPTAEELVQLSKLENNIEYLTNLNEFLGLLEDALKKMRSLLYSVTIGDMHEAVDFMITAYQFKLDGANHAMVDVLKQMTRNEQDRRKIVLEALRTVFLTTDAGNLMEHTSQVVGRLIDLVRSIGYTSLDALKALLSEWAEKGTLSNDIFDSLWRIFLQNTPGSSSRAALVLLRMSALGRMSIVEKNHHVVAHICFGERGRNDPLLAIEGIEFLLVLSTQQVSVDSATCQLRSDEGDPLWTELLELIKFYANQQSFPKSLLSNAIRLIFRLHARPIVFAETIVKLFVKENDTYDVHQLTTLNVLLGEIAINYLVYLDNDVYKELKRRQHFKQNKQNKQNMTGYVDISALKTSRNKRNQLDTSMDESMMDGAEAVDEDAEFISQSLESSFMPHTLLGTLFQNVVQICSHPEIYPNKWLQSSAITALLRGMLLSANFCEQHIKLVFTVMLKTKVVENKLTILLHIGDLLEKSPNVVEPYTTKLYTLLEDDDMRVREMCVKILGLLILRDVLLPQDHIWRLAVCVVDDNSNIADVVKSFFLNTSQKSNNLYNSMPDIFTHLGTYFPPAGGNEDEAGKAREEKFRVILKFLMALIDKPKHVENLVERFCIKFENIVENNEAGRVAFALSLMAYNDRAMQKLIDNFAKYRHFVLAEEVYLNLKQITNMQKKEKDGKALAEQLDQLMNDVFKETGANAPQIVPNNKQLFKKPRAPVKGKPKAKPTKQSRRKPVLDDDSSSEEDEPPRRRRK